MVIVRLMGGLGNQMFQYAAGRALAEKHEVDISVDITFLNDRSSKENFTYRNYELNCFNISTAVAKENDLAKYKVGRLGRIIRRIIKNDYPIHVYERSFSFMDEFHELPSNVLLEGYWQTEKYFLQIRPILINEFRWKPFTDHLNPIVCESIRKDNSVGLHVRRGDFVENAVIHNHHGVCDINYYRRAISHVNANIENPTYYVFSDDIAWAKREFASLSSVRFIDHNKGSESFRDMQLMSYCKHNIIANSSFSWWGAWLNQNENKVVVAPERWFKNLEINTTDLIPPRWIKK